MPEEEKKEKEEKEKEKSTSEVIEKEDGSVEVALKDEDLQETEEVTEEGKEKPVKKEEINIESLRNKLYAQDRIITRLTQEVETLKIPPSTTTERKEELDDLDKLAQTDWKGAVRKLASQVVDETIRKQNEQIVLKQQQEQISQTMEQNVQSVISRHSELEDQTSEKSVIFQSILNNNPRWRTSPDGPLLTMYEMEKELRKRGYDVDGEIEKKVTEEKGRMTRVFATSLPSSQRTTPSNKIILTKEQKEFCDLNGVSYEDYARTLSKTAGGKEGVEV